MPTAVELHPDGDYAQGKNNLFVAVFSDQTLYGPAGSQHTWTGVIKRISGSVVGGGFNLAIVPPSGPNNIITSGGFDSLGPGTDIAYTGLQINPSPPWSYKFIIKFAVPAVGGEYTGHFEFDLGNTTDMTFYWVRAPSTLVGQSPTDDFADWFNLEVVSVEYGVPFDFNHGVMAINAPHVFAVTKVRAKSKVVVQKAAALGIGTLIRVFNYFAQADSKVAVGRTVKGRSKSNIRITRNTIFRTCGRVGVHHVVHQREESSVRVGNYRVNGASRILIGSTVAFRYDSETRVYRPHIIAVAAKVVIGFISVENLKGDMQIVFGVDTELVSKTFNVIPAVDGMPFSQNLEQVLIEAGSETVRRLNFPGALHSWSADGLYEIDFTLGRFRWLGEHPEPIELTYRHSTTRITDQNIISSIIKASAFIQERLKSDAVTSDPRFRRGAEELAMSFLLDAAIWNMTQVISAGAAAGAGSRRIDLMQNQKREFERRAYETLGPFLDEDVPGSPVSVVLTRPSTIRLYEG